MPRRRGQNRTGKGWDFVGTPVPGNVQACLDELGIEYYRVDDISGEIHGHCPAHEERVGKKDRHPSWSVGQETGDHNCFSCGFRGPFVTLVEWALNCDRLQAVAWVKERGTIERAVRGLGKDGIERQEVEREEITEADLALYTHPPEWACDERDLDVEAVDELGILWDAEHERWITPVRDPETGRLWGWQEKNARYFRNQPEHLEKAKAVFGIQDTDPEFEDACIVVESPLDTARLRTAGLPIGVSSMGVNVSRWQMMLLIARYSTIYVALDNDRDGDRVCRDLAKQYSKRVKLMFWNYSECKAKDPGEQSDDEIWWSYENAIPSILMDFS